MFFDPSRFPRIFSTSRNSTKPEGSDTLARVKAENNMSTWMFAHASTYSCTSGTATHPAEIGAGGSLREVPIEARPGYVIQDVIPSNDRRILLYREKDLPEIGSIDARWETKNFVLYELNPSDGSLFREYEPLSAPGFGIHCEHDGTFVGFSRMEN
jgi:hypothetical protein